MKHPTPNPLPSREKEDLHFCPACGAELRGTVKHCPQCGATPFYYRAPSLIFAFLLVGPFMLPLVWRHPTYRKETKAVLTAVIVGITLLLVWASVRGIDSIFSYYRFLNEAGAGGP